MEKLPFAVLLVQLREWLNEGLIDAGEFEMKQKDLVSKHYIPARMIASQVHQCLLDFRDLLEKNLITTEQSHELKLRVLATLVHDNNALVAAVGSSASHQKSETCKEKDCASSEANNIASTGGKTEVFQQQAEEPQKENFDKKYFGYYADFAHQELMLNDSVRTGTYRQAILQNSIDFKGKVVVDVGCGTGILSLFAATAGARKVFAVEASDMADSAEKLIAHNGWSHIVTVVKGRVEDVDLPEHADILISEPLGFWLFNEQMIQSYIRARNKWLKPNGQMFPCHAKFFMAPIYVPEVRRSTVARSQAWLAKQDFHGLDFTCFEGDSHKQNMSRLIIDQILPNEVVGDPCESLVDFQTISVEELDNLNFKFYFEKPHNVLWDAVGIWYDTYFTGTGGEVCLSTAPTSRLTCWYQTIALLPEPLLQRSFSGHMSFTANSERTYDIVFQSDLDQHFKLKFGFSQPVYRYYEHFQVLIWDPTTLPTTKQALTIQMLNDVGGVQISPSSSIQSNNKLPPLPILSQNTHVHFLNDEEEEKISTAAPVSTCCAYPETKRPKKEISADSDFTISNEN